MKQGKLYIYRNKKTGATFKASVKCVGGDWEQVKEPKREKPVPVAEPVIETEIIEPEETEITDEDEAPKKQKKARK